jgi:general secretion pathway protein B
MSYILDALKKSEQERGMGGMLVPTNSAGTLAAPLDRRWWPIILALLLVIVALVVLLRFWAHDGVPAKPVAAQASAETIESRTAVTGSVERLELSRVDRPNVRDLAEQAGVRLGKRKPEWMSEPKSPKATPEVATMAGAAPPPTLDDFTQEEVPEVDPADIPFLRQMPEAFRQGVPEMVVNVHLYSANEAENLVYINDRHARKGDRIEGGVKLEAIVHDGVVLDHGGTKFKLPRPN